VFIHKVKQISKLPGFIDKLYLEFAEKICGALDPRRQGEAV
jgi:hypothetical protein